VFAPTGGETEPQQEELEEESDEEAEVVSPIAGGVAATSSPSVTVVQPPKRPSTPPPPKTLKLPSTPPSKSSTSTPQLAAPKKNKVAICASMRQRKKHDYAKVDSVGLEHTDNDQRQNPWEGLPTTTHTPVETTQGDEEVEQSLLGIEEEWAEMAYTATSRPHDEDHPSYKESLTTWDAPDWASARDEEIAATTKMETFELCDLPPGFKLLNPLWVHVATQDQNGIVVRKKAHLVVGGNAQVKGIDHGEVFAHVLRSDTLRILFGLTAIHDWDIHGLDVKSAFLNSKVEEELYMRQIPGYKDGTNQVLQIVGSLYGLKQAPHIWNKLFRGKVLAIGYTQLPSEPSVYIRKTNNCLSILAVYVDDIAIFTTKGDMTGVKNELMEQFEMRDLGELKSFLGYRIN
jgi:hypothetical protein